MRTTLTINGRPAELIQMMDAAGEYCGLIAMNTEQFAKSGATGEQLHDMFLLIENEEPIEHFCELIKEHYGIDAERVYTLIL
jgi:hypothetical protein